MGEQARTAAVSEAAKGKDLTTVSTGGEGPSSSRRVPTTIEDGDLRRPGSRNRSSLAETLGTLASQYSMTKTQSRRIGITEAALGMRPSIIIQQVEQRPGQPGLAARRTKQSLAAALKCLSYDRKPGSPAGGDRNGSRGSPRRQHSPAEDPTRTEFGVLPSARRHWRRKMGTNCIPREITPERCHSCTAEAVKAACSAFWELDRGHKGQITRVDHIEHLRHSNRSVKRLRWLQKAHLEEYFRQTTKPLYLEDYLRLIWSSSTPEDMREMLRWADLWQAYQILVAPGFRGLDADLKKFYALLFDKTEGKVVLRDIVRANILDLDQAMEAVKGSDIDAKIEIEVLRRDIWPVIKDIYVVTDTAHANQ